MKIVAVSQRIDQSLNSNETRDMLDQKLITFLLAAGFLPVPVPNVIFRLSPEGQFDYHILKIWLEALKPEGIILSGGNDIGQSTERDLTENSLLNYAKFNKLPVLGICRGMQMLAHWAGINVHPVKAHISARHMLYGEISREVNSYHAFSIAGCPEGFKILAQSLDGEIEAIRHQSLNWEGWMWHPEREASFESDDLRRIKALFNE